MNFNIRMGIPEMQELWLDLQEKYRSGNIKKKEEQLYNKWGKALKLLAVDPSYPSLQTYEIEPLSKRYGMKVCSAHFFTLAAGTCDEGDDPLLPAILKVYEDQEIN